MRNAWIVAVREIVERRAMLAAALFAGLLPFASPLLPGVRAGQGAEARDLGALVVATAFAVGCALMLGATAIARDLSERRLAFDFARPIGGFAIWAGRLFGALALCFLVLALALAPATAIGGGAFSRAFEQTIRPGSLVLAAAILFLLPLAHVVSVGFRSRSAWLAADMVGAVIFFVAVGVTSRALFNAFAVQTATVALIVVALATIPALWCASAAQVVVGRTDLRRGHRVQSLVLWSALLGLATVHGGYAAWVFSASPDDLVDAWSQGSPRGGPWIAIGGTVRGRGDFVPTFIVNTETNDFVRAGASLDRWSSANVLFSDAGSRAVWLRHRSPRDSQLEVFVADLDRPDPTPRATTISFPEPWGAFALSSDGRRLAAFNAGLISLVDADSGATLVSARTPRPSLPANAVVALFFVGPDRARLVLRDQGLLTIHEIDATTRRLDQTGQVEVPFEFPWLQWNPKEDRILLADVRSGDRALLADGRTGALVRDIDLGARSHASFRFLADGRVVAIDRGGDALSARLLTPDGEETDRFALGDAASRAVVGAEAAPGRIVVGVADTGDDSGKTEYRTLLVDLETGTAQEVGRGLLPAWAFRWPRPQVAPEPGSIDARLFQDGDIVVLFDPLTGERKTLAGRPNRGAGS